MSITIAAIFENGVLKPQQPLALAEGAPVQVTIRSTAEVDDPLADVIGICDSGQARGGAWSEERETRRRVLIDKDIAGTISTDELAELARLDDLANEYFDRVAPPPIEAVRRLHDRLLKQRANGH